ncbi:MAG TPA: hypothetical protein VJ836_02100 [Candidatus Saccharimonadales bacterium]|nr:hypothetical protein [Candidatus Saccharimonadales bacterium]
MSEQLSRLEQVFGFEDTAFRRYMELSNTRNASPNMFMDLSSQMEHDVHPIVQCAAGWAAAEAALLRLRPSQLTKQASHPFGARQEALAAAQSHWSGVDDAFKRMRLAAVTPERAADFWGFEVRSQLALAYLPSMKVVAGWFSGEDPDPSDLEPMLKNTKEGVVKIGRAVMKPTVHDINFNTVKKGLGYEIATGLLMQNVRPLGHIILPASIRQDNNRAGLLRSDIVGVSAEKWHPKMLVGVSGHKDGRRPQSSRRHRLMIFARPDLALYPGRSPLDTLEAFVSREAGVLPDADIGRRLDDMSQVLAGRLAAATILNSS